MVVRDGIFITLQTRKMFELLLNSKYYFDFHSSNIKFRSAENKTTFWDALPETIFFLLSCTFSHLLSDLLFLMEQINKVFIIDLSTDKSFLWIKTFLENLLFHCSEWTLREDTPLVSRTKQVRVITLKSSTHSHRFPSASKE